MRTIFLLESCMWRHEVSRTHKTETLSAMTKLKGKQKKLVSSPARNKSTTFLDVHCSACLKHFLHESKSEKLPALPLMPKLTVICDTRSLPRWSGHHPWSSRMQQWTRVNITKALSSPRTMGIRGTIQVRFSKLMDSSLILRSERVKLNQWTKWNNRSLRWLPKTSFTKASSHQVKTLWRCEDRLNMT